MMILLLRICVLLLAFCRLQAFAPTQSRHRPISRLHGIPLVGRFRKKRTVEQPKTIQVGDRLPSIDVEVVSQVDGEGEEAVESVATSIIDVLGTGKAVLVGMPGAFTPTCSKEHLPGYVAATPRLLELGIEKVCVMTTNDRFVNQEWGDQAGIKSTMTLLCDGDGDLIKSIGMAEDMGFGVGVRSKRFCMVVEDGVVTNLLTDEGMDDCSNTAAGNLLEILDPAAVVEEEPINLALLGGGVAALALALAVMSGGSNAPAPTPIPTPAPVMRTQPNKQTRSEKTSFNLLNEYMEK